LNFTEKEVKRMTLKKLFLLFDKYCEWHGLKKEEETLTDIIPDLR